MTLKKGDIVLVQFPFTDLSSTKLRPALLLSVNLTLDEITLCFISSQNIQNIAPEEILLESSNPEFQATGLKISSKIRVTRIVTLQKRAILRKIGHLSKNYVRQLDRVLQSAFQLNVEPENQPDDASDN